MLLNWRFHVNPIVDTKSPLLLDLSAGNHTFGAARFATFDQGGYGDGQLTLTNPPDALVREAADSWLMRRVAATDSRARYGYEGFVAGVRATTGHHVYLRSMEQFANYIYTQYLYQGYPCPKGKQCNGRALRRELDIDTTSVTATLLGIKEEWLTVGQGTISKAQAQAAGDVKLHELLKKRGVDIDSDRLQPNTIELILWGYYTTLKFRKHTLAVSKLTEIATVVQKLLTTNVSPYAEPPAPFINTSDLSQLQTTGKTIKLNDSHEPQWVQDLIQQAIITGDVNGRKLYFQIWENRQPFLFARSTAPRYFSRSDDDRMYDASRNPIPDYLVHAGGDVVPENADPGISQYTDVLNRPYRGRIERTDYDDLREKITIPAPSDVFMTDERLLARMNAVLRRK